MSCERPASRIERLRHVRECAACRREQLGSRPERMFSLLALRKAPEDALERMTGRVMSRIGAETAGRRLRLHLKALLPVAASVILACFFGLYATMQQTLPPIATAPSEPSSEAGAPTDGIDLISTPGEAQVMEFTVGETQVVMIFDEAMDI